MGWFMQVAEGSGSTAITDTVRCWKLLTAREKEVLLSMKGIFGNRRQFGYTAKDQACVLPFVELDDHARLFYVRHTNSKFGPFLNLSSSSNIAEEMAVWRRWNSILYDHTHDAVVHLTKGDVLCLNNHRVMHGRTIVTGDRIEHGCFASQAVLENRMRLIMQAKLPPSCDDLALILPTRNLIAFYQKQFGWHKGRQDVSCSSNGTSERISMHGSHNGKMGITILDVEAMEAGSSLALTFADGASFQFSATWLVDALPTRFSIDQFRQHKGLPRDSVVDACVALSVIQDGGETAQIEWETSHSSKTKLAGKIVPAVWLHALAPLVATPLNGIERIQTAPQTERMKEGPLGADSCSGLGRSESKSKPWLTHELEVPVFEYGQLENDEVAQERFLESIMDPGVLKIRGAPVPENGGIDGNLLTEIVSKFVGKPVQHPSRANVWNIRKVLGEKSWEALIMI